MLNWIRKSLQHSIFSIGFLKSTCFRMRSLIGWAKSTKEILQLKGSRIMDNLIVNPDFEKGLFGWYTCSCTASVICESGISGEGGTSSGGYCALISNRRETWHGLEQDITAKLKANVKYDVVAMVRIRGSMGSNADVIATLREENSNASRSYNFLGRVKACSDQWVKLEGNFCLKVIPQRAVFYIEGPPAGVDLLIKGVAIRDSNCSKAGAKEPENQEENHIYEDPVENIIKNSEFDEGLVHWSGKGCKLSLQGAFTNQETVGLKNGCFVAATNRTQGWQGIEQEITGRLKARTKYQVHASVRIGGKSQSDNVLATLWIKLKDSKEQYITLGKVKASTTEWAHLKGEMFLKILPEKATVYLEGPQAGVDLLVEKFCISCVTKPPCQPPIIENPKYGENILQNSDLRNGLKGWYGLGSCSLSFASGAPCVLPPCAKISLGNHSPGSGLYIIATNRTQIWEGPAQNITEKLQLFVSYQVSAFVRIGHCGNGPQKVNVALGIDNQWVTGGEIEADDKSWKEVSGSFRLERKPKAAIVYVQGPCPGIDLMVADLRIFAVDRKERFSILKTRTDMIRKREVVIRLKSRDAQPLFHQGITIRQIKSSFPLGTCINRYSLDDDIYTQFFLDHFNWAVFENEIKWGWTEEEAGNLKYTDADDLLEFCERHGIPIRGHCILWEAEDSVQGWLKNLPRSEDLESAIRNRIADLLSRYCGKFQHYDVNNEMLHGSFYRNRLGIEIWPYVFKLARHFDPQAKLFVNDYHVEDGCDCNSSPEKYMEQIKYLQSQGACVDGIGLQGHADAPIGGIMLVALDKLAALGIPIWFTEVDVCSENEYVRADDFEVILREAFAHPAVEGVMLWGFMEKAMNRENAHLVNADGTINEAGKRLQALKKEWSSSFSSRTNEEGLLYFSAYYGMHTASFSTSNGDIQKTFEVVKGDGPLIVDICI